ncbi:hypothetical protein CPB84DRAFT_1848071 [Gymnopilus junonius]|uniref:Uncharacterized protein n=1 Tax=Gymnopilus junonius TaxID=109634 RepID=A0A9P5NIZ7_GYMJU|nr:hypothetical protein CPB84DRAFT_1848071 [Gymnopilus junonius]
MPLTVPTYKSLQDPQYMRDIVIGVPASELIAFKQYLGIPEDIINHPYFSADKRLDWVVLEQFTSYIVHVCEEEDRKAKESTAASSSENNAS